jgi:hypothetical protein
MAPMTRSGTADDDAGGAIPSLRLHALVLWAGPVACIAGLLATRTWTHWAPGRFLELLVVALAHLLVAWPVRRLSGVAMATALLAPAFVFLAVFASGSAVLATLLLLLAAIVVGGVLSPQAPIGLRAAVGLALVAGVAGWLLPLPLHLRWIYAAGGLLALLAGHRALLGAGRRAAAGWREAVAASPRAAAFAVMALALAVTGCWLPTMQFDDLGYHLSLPWQLMETGRYVPDPTHQAWALAPWSSDVVHALAQVLAAGEARGPVNAAWLAIAAAGLWRLVDALGGSAKACWLAVAVYASIPMTAGLAAGMQTETATTALLAWLAWLVARHPSDARPGNALLSGAVLAGGLLGMKLVAAMQAMLVAAWAAVTVRPWARPARLALSAVVVALVGASSYAYAMGVAGNPVLPLFNAWFQSPFFAPVDLVDARWLAGFHPFLPWSLTFDTRAYTEHFTGAAGFCLVALAGAWVVAIARPRSRALAIVATLLFFLPLVPLQYARYAYPGMVLLLAPMAFAAERVDPRRFGALLVALAIANFAFQANGNWMQRGGALKDAILAVGRDAPLLEEYAPERLLIASIRDSRDARPVMLMDDGQPRQAELGARGRTTSWYAPRVHAGASRADRDASGAAWVALWRREGIGHVVDDAAPVPARAAALARLRAVRRGEAGGKAWWQLPPEASP